MKLERTNFDLLQDPPLLIADVSGSKHIEETKMREFIAHWERMIYPYEETHDQKRAIKTVITELDTWLRVYCH